jgi:hypothetical protein
VNAGSGNDTVQGAASVTGVLALFGGDGNDSILGGNANDTIYGGFGNDTMIGAVGNDTLFGEDGNDLFGDPSTAANGVADDPGADFYNGGDGIDQFVWETGDGNDIIQGGVDGADILRFLGADATADAFTVTQAGAAPTHLNVVLAAETVDTHGVEQVILTGRTGADTVTVNDLTPTELEHLVLDLTAGDADAVTVNGRAADDNILITTSAAGTVNLLGLPGYDIRLLNVAGGAGADTLTVNGNDGNDVIKSVDGVEAQVNIVLNGNAGDDFLSADATLNGGTGDDFLEGGSGDDVINGGAGEDTMIGLAGADTFDGGTEFDTILILGTSGDDRIDANQTATGTLVHTVNGDTQTDTFSNVEEASIAAGAGDDIIRVTHNDGLVATPAASLRFTVDGGASRTRDRLGVVDDGIGDTMVYRKAEVDSAGSINVGPLNPVVFEGVEFVQPIAGGTDGIGRLVVFKHDPFEFNDSRFVATDLGTGQTLVVDPVIDPGADATFGFPADEDVYRILAETTGTLDIVARFEEIATLANGRAGLPGNGNLNIQVLDIDGTTIAGAGPNFGINDGAGELNVDGDTFNEDERIRIPVVSGQTYYLRVFGATTDTVNNYSVSITNTAAPVARDIELDDFPILSPVSPIELCTQPAGLPVGEENSDSGRSQFDNVTCDSTPVIRFRLDDAGYLHDLPGNPANDTPPDEVIAIPFETDQDNTVTSADAGYRVGVFIEGTPQQGGQLPQLHVGFARQIAEGVYEYDFGADSLVGGVPGSLSLSDGSHFITVRVQIIDPSNTFAGAPATGFGAVSQSLEIVVDATDPNVAFGETAATASEDGLTTDSGVIDQSGTFVDAITNDTTPNFIGVAEANSVVRLYLDLDGDAVFDPPTAAAGDPEDLLIGTTVAVPEDGTNQFPNGFWSITSEYDLNNVGLGTDGLRTFFVTAEDLAGNISPADSTEILIDTRGPQVTSVTRPDGISVFDPKPTTGPTPLIDSIIVNFQDFPARDAGTAAPGGPFLHTAINTTLAAELGNYLLVGDQVGVLDLSTVTVTQAPRVDGAIATASVTLTFSTPLPDDRYTLYVYDRIKDDVNNALDGESNAIGPTATPNLPSGDNDPGQTFVARFTIDSRVEIATYCCGSWYVDLNQNGSFDDPNNHDSDATNGDIVFKFGLPGDFPVAGDWDGEQFDEIGVYGLRAAGFMFELDVNSNGTLDAGDAIFPFAAGGRPIAGDWNLDSFDDVGVFNGTTWFIDLNGNFTLDAGETIPTNFRGRPIAGDWTGTGIDRVGTYRDNTFFLDINGNFQFDAGDQTILFGFAGRELPVAGDWDADGDDNIGLFVPDRNGMTPREAAEWYLDVDSDGLFEPPPTGTPGIPLVNQDIFYQFGDEFSEPVVGNFDPPVTELPGDEFDNRVNASAAALTFDAAGESAATDGAIQILRDRDVVQFTAPRNGRVSIDLTTPYSALDPVLIALDGAGQPLARNNNFGGSLDSHVEIRVKAGETYYLRAKGRGHTVGSYALAVDYLLKTADESNGAGIASGIAAHAAIQTASDSDLFAFTASVSGRHEVETVTPGGLDTIVDVLDGSGGVIAHDDNGTARTDAIVSFDAVAGQTYFIRVRGHAGTTGRYDLLVDDVLEAGL